MAKTTKPEKQVTVIQAGIPVSVIPDQFSDAYVWETGQEWVYVEDKHFDRVWEVISQMRFPDTEVEVAGEEGEDSEIITEQGALSGATKSVPYSEVFLVSDFEPKVLDTESAYVEEAVETDLSPDVFSAVEPKKSGKRVPEPEEDNSPKVVDTKAAVSEESIDETDLGPAVLDTKAAVAEDKAEENIEPSVVDVVYVEPEAVEEPSTEPEVVQTEEEVVPENDSPTTTEPETSDAEK